MWLEFVVVVDLRHVSTRRYRRYSIRIPLEKEMNEND